MASGRYRDKRVGDMKLLLLLLLAPALAPASLAGERKHCEFSERTLTRQVSKGAHWQLAPGADWTNVGAIESARGTLCVFRYFAVVGTGQRGVSRLVIFLADGTYVGSYGLSLPSKIEIHDNALRFVSYDNRVDFVDLSPKELPETIFVDGEVIPITP